MIKTVINILISSNNNNNYNSIYKCIMSKKQIKKKNKNKKTMNERNITHTKTYFQFQIMKLMLENKQQSLKCTKKNDLRKQTIN